MMEKLNNLLDWAYSKRKPVGYTVGGLNILVSLSHLLQGEFGLALLWFAIGTMLVFDAKEFK